MNNPLLDLQEEVERVGRSPFDYIEITLDAPEAHYSKVMANLEGLVRCVETYALPVICHLPTFVSLADLSPHIREASMLETIQAMEAAAALGAVKVVLHPSVYMGMGRYLPNFSAALAYEALDRLLDQSCALNLNICLENQGGRDYVLGTTPESMRTLLDTYPAVSLTLDVAHAYVAGGPSAVEAFCVMAGPRLQHVHVSDNFGCSDDHLPLGAGSIDWGAVVQTLKRYGYDGTVTFEVFSKDRGYQEISLAKFKALCQEQGNT